ncbi:MAG: flagellar motor protein MotB [Pseudomonadota bacterium]
MSEAAPTIIKKKKVSGGDGHHGGAWKVAYADFVTAMMAFFLLMWLLNATSEEQRKGLADFFDPSIPISAVSAGGAGMLNGDTMFSEDTAAGSVSEGVRAKPTNETPGDDLGELDASPDLDEGFLAPQTGDLLDEDAWPSSPFKDERDGSFGATGDGVGEIARLPADTLSETSGIAAGASPDLNEEGALSGVADTLAEQMTSIGGDGLLEHFTMRMTPEGLVIEIVDIQDEPLFRSGGAEPAPVLDELIDILVPILEQTTNDIAIAGHTDAATFSRQDGYSNWELSADRANAARRLMNARGLSPDRIVRVSGQAATNPIDPDPFASKNRRIAIILLRKGIAN